MTTADRARVADALELVALVCDRWPRPELNDDQLKRYAEDIADFDPATMRAAIDAYHRDQGGHFQPTAGELRRRAALLELAPPEWMDVRRQLVERRVAMRAFNPAPWACPVGACDGSGLVLPEDPWDHEANALATPTRCECAPARREHFKMADTLAPLVREFIDEKFVTWAEVDKIGEALGDSATSTLESQVREKWKAFASRAVESRVLASIEAAPDLARLEQARDEDEPRRQQQRGALGRPNFAGALPAPE